MRAHAVTPRAATAPPPRPARAARTPRSALGARSVRRRALDGDGGVGVERGGGGADASKRESKHEKWEKKVGAPHQSSK